MKLFSRTSGYWLFWISVLYISACIGNWYAVPCVSYEYIQIAYVITLSLPLWITPLAEWLNMKTFWDII